MSAELIYTLLATIAATYYIFLVANKVWIWRLIGALFLWMEAFAVVAQPELQGNMIGYIVFILVILIGIREALEYANKA